MSLAGLPPNAWSPRHAMHLLNRAGLGLPFPEMERLAESPEAAVALMVDYEAEPAPPVPDFILEPLTRGDLKKMHPEADTPALQLIYQERQREERHAVNQLQSWWLERMYRARDPLQEKMALFWHGHFATSAQKVKFSYSNHQIYEVFRAHATGNAKALTIAVGQCPAMLEYLDNRKSTKAAPNENWARELMELFTLGKGQYSEDDIKNSARAFTGWTCDHKIFQYKPERHDDGEKTFLGRRGNFDGWNIIDIIFEQPACAEFLAAKLWRFFAGTEPEPQVVQALAQTLRDNDYELRPLLRQLFASAEFYAPEVMGAQIKSPAQFVLRLCYDLGIEPPFDTLPRATRAIGQDLFYPPNVKGWDGNRAWINANSLLVRANLPAQLLDEKPARKQKPPASDDMMMTAQPAETHKEKKAWQQREHVLEALQFNTAGQCVDALGARFLAVPLRGAPRQALMDMLGAKDESVPMTAAVLNQQQRIALLRIITSMAEYQLC